MIKKIFYNSSFPRSGSTLIQNILGQNPDIHVTPTSSVSQILYNARAIYSHNEAFKAQDRIKMTRGIQGLLKAAIYGFYNNITTKPYVIDKCRSWSSEYKFINEFDPNPKIICMVRDIRAIFSSLEKKFRQNPLIDSGVSNWDELRGTTTEKRVSFWCNNAPIGPVLDKIQQCILDGTHDNILFIKFEDLCTQPAKELHKIYEYLNIPYYNHNFEYIEQVTHEDDKFHGIYGDHKIRPTLAPVENDYTNILGSRICDLITTGYPWFYQAFNYTI
jgi:sulfotransferase